MSQLPTITHNPNLATALSFSPDVPISDFMNKLLDSVRGDHDRVVEFWAAYAQHMIGEIEPDDSVGVFDTANELLAYLGKWSMDDGHNPEGRRRLYSEVLAIALKSWLADMSNQDLASERLQELVARMKQVPSASFMHIWKNTLKHCGLSPDLLKETVRKMMGAGLAQLAAVVLTDWWLMVSAEDREKLMLIALNSGDKALTWGGEHLEE